jgi:hypothetical protein
MSDRVKELMAKYAIDKSEIWQLPGGRSYAVKHSAVERIAAQEGVVFDLPQIVEGSSADKMVVLMGTAKLGNRVEWSFGEAAPANNKNAYPWAMAEKRLKDRLTLKLIEAHGLLYSDDELSPDPPVERMSSNALKTRQPGRWDEIVRTMRSAPTIEDLRFYASSLREETSVWPQQWKDSLREVFEVELDRLQAVMA